MAAIMVSTAEFIHQIQSSLEPYIKTREEAAFIRRILALNLDSALPDTTVTPPLALVSPPAKPALQAELRGRQRQYLEALSANFKARQDFESIKTTLSSFQPPQSSPSSSSTPSALLAHQITTAKLSQKIERLNIIEKHLDELAALPAASPSFLTPNAVENDAETSLPPVPKSVISGVGLASAQRDVVRSDLNGLLNDLEKSVLRAKLVLKKEEEALADAKATSPALNGSPPTESSVKLQALTTTRNELISWIENELSKAGDDMEEEEGSFMDGQEKPPPPTRTPGGRLHKGVAKAEEQRKMAIKIHGIREKYAQYTESRKALVQMLDKSTSAPPTTSAPGKPKDGSNSSILKTRPHISSSATAPKPKPPGSAPQAHILTPYLSALLYLSQEQKSLIQHKSHINVQLSHAARDSASALDHIAEESQLLPRFPLPKKLQRLGRLDGPNSFAPTSPGAEVLGKVKGWRYAADEAKISMLEHVAEKVEEGQLALESANTALDEADDLLGITRSGEGEEGGQEGEGDGEGESSIWLGQQASAAGKTSKRGFAAHRRMGGGGKSTSLAGGKPRIPKAKQQQRDVWARLDGDLGGLNSP